MTEYISIKPFYDEITIESLIIDNIINNNSDKKFIVHGCDFCSGDYAFFSIHIFNDINHVQIELNDLKETIQYCEVKTKYNGKWFGSSYCTGMNRSESFIVLYNCEEKELDNLIKNYLEQDTYEEN